MCTTIATSISQLPVGLIGKPNTFDHAKDNKQSPYTPGILLKVGGEPCNATKEELNWKEEQKETPGKRRGLLSIVASIPLSSLVPPKSLKQKARETAAPLISPPSKRQRLQTTTRQSLNPKQLSVTKDVVRLFIELDELDEDLLKKAASIIREKFEVALEAAVEVMDIDSSNNMSTPGFKLKLQLNHKACQ